VNIFCRAGSISLHTFPATVRKDMDEGEPTVRKRVLIHVGRQKGLMMASPAARYPPPAVYSEKYGGILHFPSEKEEFSNLQGIVFATGELSYMKHLSSLLILLALLSLPLRVHAEEKVARLGFAAEYHQDVNLKDARLAMELWSKKLEKRMGLGFKLKPLYYDDLPSLFKSVRKREVDFVKVGAVDYLSSPDRMLLEPILMGQKNGSVLEEIILVVHQESGYKNLKDLRRKKLIIERGDKTSIPGLWIDTLLLKERLLPSRKFFSALIFEDSPSRPALPVYFRQADACVMSAGALETMREMNPQIGRKLITLNRSAGYVMTLFAAHRDCDPGLKERLIKAATTVSKDVEGRQFLTLFRIDGVMLFEPGALVSTEKLILEHQRLSGRNR